MVPKRKHGHTYQQWTTACITNNMLHFWHSKICPNHLTTALLLYIEADTHCDYWILFKRCCSTFIIIFLIMRLFYNIETCVRLFTQKLPYRNRDNTVNASDFA